MRSGGLSRDKCSSVHSCWASPELSRATRGPVSATTILTAQDGAAYVEFLIAFFPILLLFVGLLQLQVVYVTRLFVSRAAFAAARAEPIRAFRESPSTEIRAAAWLPPPVADEG